MKILDTLISEEYLSELSFKRKNKVLYNKGEFVTDKATNEIFKFVTPYVENDTTNPIVVNVTNQNKEVLMRSDLDDGKYLRNSEFDEDKYLAQIDKKRVY